MPGHDDVPYKEHKVDPPNDLDWHRDDAGFLVFTGTCPVCQGWTELPLIDIAPGTIPKAWPWGKKEDATARERRMDCECPITHPQNADELPGCGAWWPVTVPVRKAS
ncbi:hypothetical protein ACFY1L_06495 [Streptomyces sp. NPDC001663]|uniref:hypothetical protein n=1 Tax=Streptomyces sp. NPDC001663 TaxID=3364597 RepID=UPI00367C8C6C